MNTLFRLKPIRRKACILILAAALLLPACRLSYVIQAAQGQLRMLSGAVPVEEALLGEALSTDEVNHIRLSYRVRSFAVERLGLTPSESYTTLYLGPRSPTVYAVCASPKDRLAGLTWWFPIVGPVPYLGFFDEGEARAQAALLAARGLDTFVGRADAYSTLGWFRDPLTRDLLRRPTCDFVEILIHEMVHESLYVPGQGAFNEGLASLVGMYGALAFLEATFGPNHPLTVEAREAIQDARQFALFLDNLLTSLEAIYGSPVSLEEKMRLKEETFSSAKRRFLFLESRFRTDHFTFFSRMPLNNATLLAVALYHRPFPLLETLLLENEGSVKDTLALLKRLTGGYGDALGAVRVWLRDRGALTNSDWGLKLES